jgi:hypothetical protein
VLFGNTGGVMEAAVRTVYEVVTGKVGYDLEYQFIDVRVLAQRCSSCMGLMMATKPKPVVL